MRIFFLLLLIGVLPVFVWAVMTQRIELRKYAATAEPPQTCWNKIIQQNGKPQWPNACKGMTRTDRVCTQVLVPLSDQETAAYTAWVTRGRPYLPGCMPTPTPNPTCIPRPACLDTNPACELAPPQGNVFCPPEVHLSCNYSIHPARTCPAGYICQYPENNHLVGQDGVCVKSSTITPTPSCYYKQVECVKGPCEAILVCPTITPTPTPGCIQFPSCIHANPPCAIPAPNAGQQYCPPPPGCTQVTACPINDTSGQCVIHVVCPITPTATPTVTPTLTPTPLPPTPTPTPAPQTIKFRVKLDGVTDDSAQGAAITVKFSLKDGSTVQLSQPLTLSYLNNGIYQATATLTNPFAAGTQFSVHIKGEKHVAVKFCRQVGQTGPCADTEFITEPNPIPLTYEFDFTGIALPPGDLYVQDGRADQADVDKLTALLSKPRSSLTETDLLTGDLNYDGVVNGFDLNLLLKTLQTRYDE